MPASGETPREAPGHGATMLQQAWRRVRCGTPRSTLRKGSGHIGNGPSIVYRS